MLEGTYLKNATVVLCSKSGTSASFKSRSIKKRMFCIGIRTSFVTHYTMNTLRVYATTRRLQKNPLPEEQIPYHAVMWHFPL